MNRTSKSKTTRRERFLADMEQVVPWKELEEEVSPVAQRREFTESEKARNRMISGRRAIGEHLSMLSKTSSDTLRKRGVASLP
jgi:hypothetical protein